MSLTKWYRDIHDQMDRISENSEKYISDSNKKSYAVSVDPKNIVSLTNILINYQGSSLIIAYYFEKMCVLHMHGFIPIIGLAVKNSSDNDDIAKMSNMENPLLGDIAYKLHPDSSPEMIKSFLKTVLFFAEHFPLEMFARDEYGFGPTDLIFMSRLVFEKSTRDKIISEMLAIFDQECLNFWGKKYAEMVKEVQMLLSKRGLSKGKGVFASIILKDLEEMEI